MTYYVYTDMPSRCSKIHKAEVDGGCGRYEKRKPDPLPNN